MIEMLNYIESIFFQISLPNLDFFYYSGIGINTSLSIETFKFSKNLFASSKKMNTNFF